MTDTDQVCRDCGFHRGYHAEDCDRPVVAAQPVFQGMRVHDRRPVREQERTAATTEQLQHFRVVMDDVPNHPAIKRLLANYTSKPPVFGITFWAHDTEEAQAFAAEAMGGSLGAWHVEIVAGKQ